MPALLADDRRGAQPGTVMPQIVKGYTEEQLRLARRLLCRPGQAMIARRQLMAAIGLALAGCATPTAPGMPKSGHLANPQAKLAAAALLQLLKGEAVNPAPVVMNTCCSFVTPNQAAHVASVHQCDAAEKTMKTVAG